MKAKRIQDMENFLIENGSSTLEQLCSTFNVSENTIRRDINQLIQNGLVKKVYGGVIISNKNNNLNSICHPSQLNYSKELDIIGEKAASMVNDGDIILISSGTTSYYMVRHLKNKKDITVITNNIFVIIEALNYDNIKLIVLGGDIHKSTNSIIGLEALVSLEKMNTHKVFLGTNGLSINTGFTNSSNFEVEIKKAMVKASDKIIVMADHTKFDVVSLYTFLGFKDVDVLITDQLPNAQYIDCFAQNNVQLIVADDKTV